MASSRCHLCFPPKPVKSQNQPGTESHSCHPSTQAEGSQFQVRQQAKQNKTLSFDPKNVEIKQRGIIGIKTRKGDIKLYILADVMTLSFNNPKESTRKVLVPINTFHKLLGYKIKRQNL